MVLDLNHLTEHQFYIWKSAKEKVLEDYKELSGRLLESGPQELWWYINNVTSRNTFMSVLFNQLLSLNVVDSIMNDGSDTVDTIILDDSAIVPLVKEKYPNQIVKCETGSSKETSIAKIRHLGKYIVWTIGALLSKSKARKQAVCAQKSIVIFDNFDTDLLEKSNSFIDRHFGDIYKRFADVDKKNIYVTPIYLPVPKKEIVNAKVRNSCENLLFMFDFLTFSDYLSVLKKRRNPLQWDSIIYNGYKIGSLLENVYHRSNSIYYYYALLYERFVKRLKEAGIEIKHVVDWYENQSYDRALYYSFHKYYPQTTINAYIGFLSTTSFTIPTEKELEREIAPRIVFTNSDSVTDAFMSEGYQGILKTAPAYRAQSIWVRERVVGVHERPVLFVPLGLDLIEIERKCIFIQNIIDSQIPMEIQIKPHPDYQGKLIDALKGNEKVYVKKVSGNIYDYLTKCDMVLATNSTVLYEAISMGVPLMSDTNYSVGDCIERPNNISEKLWYEVKDISDLKSILNKIEKIPVSVFVQEGERMRAYYFNPLNNEQTKDLFCLSSDIKM